MRADVTSGRCRDVAVRTERIANKVGRAIDRVVWVTAPRRHLQARPSLHRDRNATRNGSPFNGWRPEGHRRVEHDVAETRQG